MQPKVQLKGIREGLLVSLGDGEWVELEETLLEQLELQGDFLRGAKLILDVENHALNAATLGSLRDKLSDRGLGLWAVISHSPITQQNAQALGMATRIHQSNPNREAKTLDTRLDGDPAILVNRTIRSGNSVTYDGHIVVIGDVNPGGEVIAGGNVVVWGRLRGMVQAGADGDESCMVCALDLSPTQLRIAEKIVVPPVEDEGRGPEIARIREGEVVAETWNH
ncbi:MAG: septum site-determining protein MinC [Chloroflexota bacterium]